MPAEMDLAEILKEAHRLDDEWIETDLLTGGRMELDKVIRAFYRRHGPRLVQVAEAAVEMREAAERFRVALAGTAGCDCPWDACDHWRPVTEAAYATANAVLSALSSPPRAETKDTVMAPSMFGAGLLVPTRPMAVTDAPPADAATEAVRALTHQAVIALDLHGEHHLSRDLEDALNVLSTPAPAPSAKEGRT